MRLKIVCSWCGKVMGFKEIPEEDMPPLPITHSICPECEAVQREENDRILQDHKTIQSQERR